jgi:threonine/homoserine/homoserine lactone efflux protein
MEISLWLRGIVLGFSIAAPVGPIGVLCIRRTLAEGRAVGFVSGIGAATADAFYGALAAFGISVISNVLISGQSWLRLIGGLFLIVLGVRTFFSRPAQNSAAVRPGRGLLGAYGSTLALTLTNPMTILSFAAIFAGAGLSEGASGGSAALLVLGVFCGSALWWLTLSGLVGLFRSRFSPDAMQWINRASGIIVAAFGVAALLSLFR